MTHREKVDHLIQELGQRGLGAATVAPPFFRLLWLLGLKVPPPLFLGFATLTLLMGGLFGVLWGAAMWFFQWRFGRMPAEMTVLATAVAGLLFGLAMAWYYRRKARRLGLPAWESYPA